MKQQPPVYVVLVTAAIIGIGLVAGRGGFDGFTALEAATATAAGLAVAAVYFGAIHILLMGWDRIWASLKRSSRRVRERD